MKIEILQNKEIKLAYAYFILGISLMLYIYVSKQNMVKNYDIENSEAIIQHYRLYQKIYQIASGINSILIENKEYIDQKEMIEEMAKSTPLPLDKQQMQANKYDLIFQYISKDHISKSVKAKIDQLQDKEYIVQSYQDRVELIGRVENSGYVTIFQHKAQNALDENLDGFFIKILIFGALNILLFFYFIQQINRNRALKFDMEHSYKVLEEGTKKIAFEDSLTKAASRLKFDESLKDLIQIASRFEQSRFGIVMFDVDNFKSINDTFGHDCGDRVLKAISNCVKENIRSSDTFARWGGEEFVVLCAMSDIKQTLQLAQKLRKKIEQISFKEFEKITCSFGAVVYDKKKDSSADALMKRVDALLYKAKQNGKNRVEN